MEELVSRLSNTFEFYVMHEDRAFYEDRHNDIVRVHSPAITSKSTSIPSLNDLINTAYLLLKHRKEIDIFYFLGPDAAICAILAKMFRKRVMINPDGIEWKRLIKRSEFVPIILKPIYLAVMVYMYFMEWLSCKVSDVTVADSINIKSHLERQHKAKKVVYIAYGARELDLKMDENEETTVLQTYGLKQNEYYLTVARIVAENNIHIEIIGFGESNSKKKLVVVGNFNKKDSYTKYLFNLKSKYDKVLFINPIYDKVILGIFRKNCYAYIHAYEVGGTNPSLLEQILFDRPIIIHDVPFSREILWDGGIYFKNEASLAECIKRLEKDEFDFDKIRKRFRRIQLVFNWDVIARKYLMLFNKLLAIR